MPASWTAHLHEKTERNIHIIRDDVRFTPVESLVQDAARSLSFTLAELEGSNISSEADLIAAVAHALKFPLLTDDMEAVSWASVADYMSDLHWLVPNEDARDSGVVLFYKRPEVLLKNDVVGFATFLDIVGMNSQQLPASLSFHFVVGPLSYQYEYLGNLMKVSQHFCEECQMADPDD